jgi:glycosyltransferase involved in cell wall biosynthesis
VSRPLRVALLSAEYPPFHWGGVGTLAWGLANGLARRGHEVTVFTRKHELPPVENHEGIRFVQVPWTKLPMAFALSFGRNAVEAVIREGKGAFDVVEVQSNMTLLPRDAYARLPYPVLSHMSGTWEGERSQLRLSNIAPLSKSGVNDLAVKWLSSRYDKYEDYALLQSDGVVVESDAEDRAINARMQRRGHREGAGGDFLVKRGHVRRIYGPLETGAFDRAKRDEQLRAKYTNGAEHLFLFVGRLAGRKNPKEAVEILSAYNKSGGNAALLVIGEGNQRRAMEKLARARGVSSNVHFWNRVPMAELQMLYACSDLFVFPALWEGFGYVMVEAAASGLPVLHRGVGGAPEAVPQDAGARYATVEEAVAAIPRLLALDRAAIAARAHEVFSFEKSISQYEAFMADLVDAGKTRSAPATGRAAAHAPPTLK